MVRVERGLWLGLLALSTLVYSGDSPPPTLPRAFVEQLPVLIDMPDEEFEALLAHVRRSPPPWPTTPERPAREEDRHAP